MDDFDRNIYCLAGLPFDAIDMEMTISTLRESIRTRTRCFLSTPNTNFLIASRSDVDFRNSVIQSDLVVADGMPILWLALLLRVPIRERVAGSSLFDAIRHQETSKPISVYFFGGHDGVAELAALNVNETKHGLTCVGYQSPGFASVEDMSTPSNIEQINASNADFLVVSLGAKKGQAFICRNLKNIKVPLISHLGAVVNFEAKILERAPKFLQRIGFEWTWRIKEEPLLWKRYWSDGLGLLRLLITDVLPHSFWLTMNKKRLINSSHTNSVHYENQGTHCRIIISGFILDPISPQTRALLRKVCEQKTDVVIDLANADYLSSGFLGLLLLLKKNLDNNGNKLELIGAHPSLLRLLKWNGLPEFAMKIG